MLLADTARQSGAECSSRYVLKNLTFFDPAPIIRESHLPKAEGVGSTPCAPTFSFLRVATSAFRIFSAVSGGYFRSQDNKLLSVQHIKIGQAVPAQSRHCRKLNTFSLGGETHINSDTLRCLKSIYQFFPCNSARITLPNEPTEELLRNHSHSDGFTSHRLISAAMPASVTAKSARPATAPQYISTF